MRLSLLLGAFLFGAFLFGAILLGAATAAAQPADAVTTAYDDLAWVEIVPGVSFAATHGDWQVGAHGKLIRFEPGASAPMHTHTHAYRGVMLQGRLTNPYQGQDSPPEMGPGDYWYVPGEAPHSNVCVSEEPCLFYTYGDAAWDIAVVEDASAEDAAAEE